MNNLLLTLLPLCGPDGPVLRGSGLGLVLALGLAGAAGSGLHCAPMCGPFVLAQAGARLGRVPVACLVERHRFSSALLLPYHAGRAVTYGVLGALAGLTGGALAALPWLGWLRGALLLIAALGFLAEALRRLTRRWVWHVPALPWPARARLVVGGVAARLDPGSWRGSLGLGLVLGLLPCGFLYAALTVAAASGSALIGGLGLAAFALGTAPALMLTALAGRGLAGMWQQAAARLLPVVMIGNAALLGALAVANFVALR